MAKWTTAAMCLGLIGIIGCAAYGQPDRSTNGPGATQEESMSLQSVTMYKLASKDAVNTTSYFPVLFGGEEPRNKSIYSDSFIRPLSCKVLADVMNRCLCH